MNEKISLQNLSSLLAEKAAITKKEAETFLREYFEVLSEELIKSGLLKIKDFGTFRLSPVEDRESIDVTTGERVLIPAHYKIVFTPDKKLAEMVNEPFAFFETIEIEEKSVSEELKLLPGEEASDESEPMAEEEEEMNIEEYPDESELSAGKYKESAIEEESTLTKDSHLVGVDEKEKPVLEEKLTPDKETKNFCLDCHDYKAHRVYREKYFTIKKKLKRLRVIICILSVFLVAALGCITYLIYRGKYISFAKKSPIVAKIESVVEEDSLSEISQTSSDSILLTGKPEQTVEDSVKNEIRKKTTPSSLFESKQITVAPGQRLTSIALEEYGNKVFWIYIYLENKTIIPDPEVLPIGLKISIPPAGKYGIDCNDSASIQKAKKVLIKRP